MHMQAQERSALAVLSHARIGVPPSTALCSRPCHGCSVMLTFLECVTGRAIYLLHSCDVSRRVGSATERGGAAESRARTLRYWPLPGEPSLVALGSTSELGAWPERRTS